MKTVLFILTMAFGEGLAIYVELLSAHNVQHNNETVISQVYKQSWALFIASIILVATYSYGIKMYKTIWIPSVLSVTSVLIVEPILVFWMFRELPSLGCCVGFILGVLGMIATLVL